MKTKPIDAHQTEISLVSLREKLGEIALTTMIRIRNTSEEPMRIKSGFQLIDGKYIKDLELGKPGCKATYHLYPIEEIPPRTEVVFVARSDGRNWLPTSGITGNLTFVNLHQTVSFQIRFTNGLNIDRRMFSVNADVSGADVSDNDWQISKEIYEALVVIGKRSIRFGSINQHQKDANEQYQEMIQPPVSSSTGEIYPTALKLMR